MIYFIQEGINGPIKIGYVRSGTTEKIIRRLLRLQVGNSHQLTVRTIMPGGRAREEYIQNKFMRARIRGEWFDPIPELIAFMEEQTSFELTSEVLRIQGWAPPSDPLIRKMFDKGLVEWRGIRKDPS